MVEFFLSSTKDILLTANRFASCVTICLAGFLLQLSMDGLLQSLKKYAKKLKSYQENVFKKTYPNLDGVCGLYARPS